MAHGEDGGKRETPPGGEALQRRRAFLDKRGLPLEDETEDEPTEEEGDEEDEQQPDEGATPPEPVEDPDPAAEDRSAEQER